jgi:hypothetical protein
MKQHQINMRTGNHSNKHKQDSNLMLHHTLLISINQQQHSSPIVLMLQVLQVLVLRVIMRIYHHGINNMVYQPQSQLVAKTANHLLLLLHSNMDMRMDNMPMDNTSIHNMGTMLIIIGGLDANLNESLVLRL